MALPTDPAPPPAPALVIAAGGEGRRIGGAKHAQPLAGQSLIDHVIAWAATQSDCLAVALRPEGSIAPLALPVLRDAQADVGPIAALESAMVFAAQQGRSHVMLVGCDMPFLPSDLISRLSAVIGAEGAALPERAGRLHTLAGLWRVDPPAVADWIARGERSLWGYGRAAGLVVLDWPEAGPDPFANVNTPEDLRAAEARLTAGGR